MSVVHGVAVDVCLYLILFCAVNCNETTIASSSHQSRKGITEENTFLQR